MSSAQRQNGREQLCFRESGPMTMPYQQIAGLVDGLGGPDAISAVEQCAAKSEEQCAANRIFILAIDSFECLLTPFDGCVGASFENGQVDPQERPLGVCSQWKRLVGVFSGLGWVASIEMDACNLQVAPRVLESIHLLRTFQEMIDGGIGSTLADQ